MPLDHHGHHVVGVGIEHAEAHDLARLQRKARRRELGRQRLHRLGTVVLLLEERLAVGKEVTQLVVAGGKPAVELRRRLHLLRRRRSTAPPGCPWCSRSSSAPGCRYRQLGSSSLGKRPMSLTTSTISRAALISGTSSIGPRPDQAYPPSRLPPAARSSRGGVDGTSIDPANGRREPGTRIRIPRRDGWRSSRPAGRRCPKARRGAA